MKLIILLIAFFTNLSHAADNSSVIDRLERIENDVNFLQRKVYNSNNSSADRYSNGSNVSGYADNPASLGDIEDTLRKIKGDIEELGYSYKDLKNKLQKLSDDAEYRLKLLENSVNTLDNNVVLDSNSSPNILQDKNLNSQDIKKKELSKKSTITDKAKQVDNKQRNPLNDNAVKPVKLESDDTSEVVNTSTAQEAYDHALSSVKNLKYDEAVNQWKEFIELYPDDKLTSNAYYWYGESLFALKKYDQSSIQFLRGYKKFPKSAKAPETLLKLSASLHKINKKQEACAALVKATKEYPNLGEITKKKIKDQYKLFGCEK